MFDSVPPAESEPIGGVSSGWLRAARWSALICTIALGVGFVAVAAAHDSMVALIFLVPGGRSVLRCSFFCSVGGRIHWHLRLVWARRRLSLRLLGVASFELSRSGFPLGGFPNFLFIGNGLVAIMPPFS